jgi:Domain of unknown function (DUF4184)
MPFTAAHPMAVLPFLRWHERLRLDATCLVIGSMAPDFEYFARDRVASTISHTVRGLWLWNLPATLVIAVVFHVIVKWPVLSIAPTALASRLAASFSRPWPRRWSVMMLVSCAASALLGAATHLAWDSITHAMGWGPQHIRELRAVVELPVLGPMALHRVLQHLSTLVGLVVVGVVVARILRRTPPETVPETSRTTALWVFAVCIAVASCLTIGRIVFVADSTDVGDLVVGPIDGVLAGTIVASVLLRARGRRFRDELANHQR